MLHKHDKSIAGRYRPVRVTDGPITARYRFIMNASWLCAQRKLKSMHPRSIIRAVVVYMRPVKIVVRLRKCAGWSESSLGARWRYVFWRCDWFVFAVSLEFMVKISWDIAPCIIFFKATHWRNKQINLSIHSHFLNFVHWRSLKVVEKTMIHPDRKTKICIRNPECYSSR